jgi:hypothetical protein
MKIIAIVSATFVAMCALAASAQYPGRWTPREYLGYECWNSHANHYETVRPGPLQGDLDFSRCRPAEGSPYGAQSLPPPAYAYPEERGTRYAPGYGGYRQGVPPVGYECWNSNAGHYESVRPGPPQGDLDFSRCRPMQ